ncbi:ABC transporter permease subunit [Mesorhizobium japonicum]|uniref:ABC transporter permease protein n=1 Tax=Mesorhizobium japonicum (strain LMG 29417 / CECT 9101 / MAFF 303099) TaxID=266835 RepID=Q989W7_RHILO|nr:ABC transporter permease subunit [Mesorhizobium japonicum]BAB52577.1 ABC transporter permease protein [Mesorhizobium japonicum MAFF 303099]
MTMAKFNLALRGAKLAPNTSREAFVLLAPATVILGVCFFIPLAGLVALSFLSPEPTLMHYKEFLGSWTSWVILGRTFSLALSVTSICLLLGYPLAYWIVSARAWVSGLLVFAVVLPFFTSYLVRSYAWMVLLGRFGIINQFLMKVGFTERPLDLIYNQFSVDVAMVYMLLPFTVMVLSSVMRGISPSLTRAASSLGAAPGQNFWRIFFPLSMPGVVASSLIVFVFALGFYITPALLGGPRNVTLPMLIDTYVNGTLNWPLAAAVATVLLLITLFLYTVSNRFVGTERLLGSGHLVASSKPSTIGRSTSGYVKFVDTLSSAVRVISYFIPSSFSSVWERAAIGRIIFYCVGLAVVAFLVCPIFIIIPISFSSSRFLDFPPPGLSLQWYEAYFTNGLWLSSTRQSLIVGFATAFVSLTVGTAAALALVRGSARMRRIGYQLLLAPMIVPSIVSAVAVYFLFSKLGLVDTTMGLVLAHSIGATPLVVLIVAASLQSQNIRLEHAAASLGASRIVTIRKVVLPLIRPTLFVAGFFAFLHSFDEVVLSLFVSGPNTMTLPIKMWSGVREDITPTIAAVSSLLIGFTVILYGTIEVVRLRNKRKSK